MENHIPLPYYYSVLNDKISFLFYYGFLLQKNSRILMKSDLIQVSQSWRSCDSHAIVSVNKLCELSDTIHYDILCSISMKNRILLMNMDVQQFNILNKTKTIALKTLKF
jgi:hypothetical protein